MDMKFSQRMKNVKSSAIRELLKLTEQPEVISLAGGTPAPELFPIEGIRRAAEAVLLENGSSALQYSTTEGNSGLRIKIAQRMNSKFGTAIDHDNVLITTGSQQGIDFTGKLFLDRDSIVLCESPTYLAAVSALGAYECKFVEVPTDQNGMIPSELERILETTADVRMIYVVPSFQNPSGVLWPLERRLEFINVTRKYNIPVIEDNPYAELSFDGPIMPSLMSLDTAGNVIYLGTFSKILCPGLRIGWVSARKDILHKYIQLKQGADLHTSSFDQCLVSKYLEMYDLDKDVEKIKDVYRNRRNVMLDSMDAHFPSETVYTKPAGGLFSWVVLPKAIDSITLLEKSIKRNVAFVPGGDFFPNGGHRNTMRLNFSNMSEEKIAEGIRVLGEILRAETK